MHTADIFSHLKNSNDFHRADVPDQELSDIAISCRGNLRVAETSFYHAWVQHAKERKAVKAMRAANETPGADSATGIPNLMEYIEQTYRPNTPVARRSS